MNSNPSVLRITHLALIVAASLAAQPAFFRKDISVGDAPTDLVIADFNADARPDMMITAGRPRRTSVRLNLGGGNFGPPIQTEFGVCCSFAPADFNGDGKIDLASGTHVFLGRGDGAFLPPLETGIAVAWAVATGDFNGDGKPDLAVGESSMVNPNELRPQPIVVLLGNGDGTFHRGPARVAWLGALHVADFNRDGQSDLAVANGGSDTVAIFLGQGDGTFDPPREARLPNTGYSWMIQISDFNRDGLPDIITWRTVLLGKGDGTFQPPLPFDSYGKGEYPHPSGIADFDGDGLLDILMIYQNEGTGADIVSVFAGKGDGTVSGSVEYGVGQQPGDAVAADLDGDGRPDIAVTNPQSNFVSLLLNQFGLPGAVSSASLRANTGAPGSLMTLFVSTSATEPASAIPPWPARLGGISLEVRDSTGVARLAPLLHVSETQINFQVPTQIANGPAILSIAGDHGLRPAGVLQVESVAPALFMVSHANWIPAATAMKVAPDLSQTPLPVFTCSSRNPNQPEVVLCETIPLPLTGDPIYVSFYGTGFRGADSTKVRCLMNGSSMPVSYAGPQGTPGVDQIDVRLSPELLDRVPGGQATWVEVVLSLDGIPANWAWIKVQ